MVCMGRSVPFRHFIDIKQNVNDLNGIIKITVFLFVCKCSKNGVDRLKPTS